MSSKVDSLLKKATTFERLALYGDRKSFLKALAQNVSTDAAPWSTHDEPGDPRGQQSNWVPQIENGQKKYVYIGPAIPPGGVAHTPSLWDRYFRPHQYPDQPDIIMPGSAPVGDQATPVDHDPNLMFQKQLNAPAVPEREAPAPAVTRYSPDPATTETLQIFLNSAFKPEISAGQVGPIAQDGKFGPETSGRLQQWARKNNVSATDVRDLINIALGRK